MPLKVLYTGAPARGGFDEAEDPSAGLDGVENPNSGGAREGHTECRAAL